MGKKYKLPFVAAPYCQARMRHLYDLYNHAGTSETLTLQGRIIKDKYGITSLAWEFGNEQPIRLLNPEINFNNFVNKDIEVAGKKEFIKSLKGDSVFLTDHYLRVKEIREKEFPWRDELLARRPEIECLTDYFPYFNSESQSESALKGLILASIGNNKIGETTGLGLSAYIPEKYHPKMFDSIKETFEKIDPFKGIQQTDRLSIAKIADPNFMSVVERKIGNYREIDYIAGTRPHLCDDFVIKIIQGKSDLFALVGRDGLNLPKVDEEFVDDLRYPQFYANKLFHPSISKEMKEGIRAAANRVADKINERTAIENSEILEIAAATKMEAVCTSYAKSEYKDSIDSSCVKNSEKIVSDGMLNVMCDPYVADKLFEKTVEFEKRRKEGNEGLPTYKKLSSIRGRIFVELKISPMSREELWERLSQDFDKKLFDRTVDFMVSGGYIYESRGKLNSSENF